MNVALTRARSSLFILGNAPTLERSDATWKDIVLDARSRSALFDVRVLPPRLSTVPNFTQTDSTYFTRSTTNQLPPLVSPSKETNVIPVAQIPSDLITPRDFKVTIRRGSEPKPLQGNLDHEPSTHVPAPLVSTVGVKRPVENDDHLPRPPPPRSGEEAARPRVPSAKRPKHPPNIFIPKSNKVKY